MSKNTLMLNCIRLALQSVRCMNFLNENIKRISVCDCLWLQLNIEKRTPSTILYNIYVLLYNVTALSYFPVIYFISCKQLIYEFVLLTFSLQNLAMNLQQESMNARWKRKSATTDGQKSIRAARQHAAYVTLTAYENK